VSEPERQSGHSSEGVGWRIAQFYFLGVIGLMALFFGAIVMKDRAGVVVAIFGVCFVVAAMLIRLQRY
jgi:hypothetical protein